MNELLIGYARVSTNEQDLTAQQDALERLGVRPALIYTDHGLTGTNRARPGLREALAACRSGDTLVVAKLDRLARSLRDAKDIIDELTSKDVKLSIGGSVRDPNDPVGRLLFNVLAMVAEFESDLIRARTREGMQVAKAKGRLRGKQPKLSNTQQKHLMEVHNAGTHSTAELAELYYVAVAEDQRGSGLGRRLMVAAEHWLREQGAVKVQLMVRSTNDAVLGFYDHLGYEHADVEVRSKWLR